MIDLHTHTTASDGRCSPAELVARAAAAGIRVLAVTDHDTVAGCEAAEAASSAAGIEFVNGVEITAIRDGGDVHVLGYFIDRHSPSLLAFLATQRQRRIDRVRQVIERLASFDIQLDADLILQPGIDDPAKSVGRPWIARALVEFSAELRGVLKKEGFLTRDPRMKERKKYGQPGARKRFQFSKR